MIAVRSFADRQVAVFGLARSGLAAVRALKAGGAEVFAWDDKDDLRRSAAAEGAATLPWRDWPWNRHRRAGASPGVPLTHPRPHDIVVKAKQAGVEVIGDIELFAREIRPEAANRAPVIAITGTNGKSTTTALIGHILAAPAATRRSAAISASRRSNCRRRVRRRSMCWRCRPTRSIWRPASSPTWRSCSTSRPTTSTATARWKTMSRSRPAAAADVEVRAQRRRRRRLPTARRSSPG